MEILNPGYTGENSVSANGEDINKKLLCYYAKLTLHINKNAEAAGYTGLSVIHKSTVHSILDETEIKPFRIKYYCENWKLVFDSRLHNVLLVYKQLSMQFDEERHLIPWVEDKEIVHVLSYDEKSGIQAIATISEDLLPDELQYD